MNLGIFLNFVQYFLMKMAHHCMTVKQDGDLILKYLILNKSHIKPEMSMFLIMRYVLKKTDLHRQESLLNRILGPVKKVRFEKQ